MKDDRKPNPEKTAGYKQLVKQFGAAAVADRLLAKWISDEDATEKWEKLSADVEVRLEDEYDAMLQRMERARKPYTYWVVLWYLSNGYKDKDVAEQLGLSIHTIKRDVTYARKQLDLVGAPLTQVVAKAIRLGFIP